MPSKDLSPVESQLALLAIQKKNHAQALAQDAYNLAEKQFLVDVQLITSAHEVPDGMANFHIENGKGTVSWPDISPKSEDAA